MLQNIYFNETLAQSISSDPQTELKTYLEKAKIYINDIEKINIAEVRAFRVPPSTTRSILGLFLHLFEDKTPYSEDPLETAWDYILMKLLLP